jgi:hypothetical protein
VNVSRKEVVDSLFLVAVMGMEMDCLHKTAFVLIEITPLQERAESERPKKKDDLFNRQVLLLPVP